MTRSLLSVLLCCAACSPVLDGNMELIVGRAMIVPCTDASDKATALLMVESRNECWPSFPEERFSCEERQQAIVADPSICTAEIVFDSPSEVTLTGFFSQPFDAENLIGASIVPAAETATTIEKPAMYSLPCNPDGQFAQDYPAWQDGLRQLGGSVRVTEDNGATARLEYNLQDEDGADAVVGVSDAEVCR